MQEFTQVKKQSMEHNMAYGNSNSTSSAYPMNKGKRKGPKLGQLMQKKAETVSTLSHRGGNESTARPSAKQMQTEGME